MTTAAAKNTRRVDLKTKVFADLPAPAAQLVWDVVAATRLRRTEKRGVAEELVDHFKAGLEGGATAEDLAQKFGDVKQAAKLIRRAKLRNRSVTEKFCVFLLRTMAAMVVFYALLTGYYLTGKPNPKVDYLAMMNAKAAAVPEQDRAWPLYREVLQKLEKLPGDEKLFGVAGDSSWIPKPGGDHWDVSITYLDQHENELRLLREAASKPSLGFVVVTYTREDELLWFPEAKKQGQFLPQTTNTIVNAMAPYTTGLLTLTDLLCIDMRKAAVGGNHERVMADFKAIMAISQHLREYPHILNDLCAISAAGKGVENLGFILEAYPDVFTTTELKIAAHLISILDLKIRLECTRITFLDVLQNVYTDDGHGDGRLTRVGVQFITSLTGDEESNTVAMLLLPATLPTTASRKTVIEHFDRKFALAERESATPLWLSGGSQFSNRMRIDGNPFMVSEFLVDVYLPYGHEVGVHGQYSDARMQAATVVIALELYRRKHGKWPASLDELSPAFLPKIPTDPHDGKPLKYALVDGKPVVYSVGSDRDDDHGRAAISPVTGKPAHDAAREWIAPSVAKENPASVPDGDWVLWPLPMAGIGQK